MMIKKASQNMTARGTFRGVPVFFPAFGAGFLPLLVFCTATFPSYGETDKSARTGRRDHGGV
jgi:hypothetical protein